MKSDATTVEAYLAALPEDRRRAIEAVRKVILDNLDEGYEEGIQYGMIGYYVPHRVYPAGYHCDPKQPLAFAALHRLLRPVAAGLGRIPARQARALRAAFGEVEDADTDRFVVFLGALSYIGNGPTFMVNGQHLNVPCADQPTPTSRSTANGRLLSASIRPCGLRRAAAGSQNSRLVWPT